jgi:cytochrome c
MKSMVFAALFTLPLAVSAAAEGDPAAGEKVFRKCKACHMVGDDAKNRVGPVLNGIVGAPVAAVDGFTYSDVFQEKAAEGVVWSEEELAAFLASPRKYAKGTKMAFAGLRKDEEIADVIAYLATFE